MHLSPGQDLGGFATEDLVRELTNRNALPRCRCGKWGTRISAWDEDGYTLRCAGCLKSILKCRC
jgi:hypothetical protein